MKMKYCKNLRMSQKKKQKLRGPGLEELHTFVSLFVLETPSGICSIFASTLAFLLRPPRVLARFYVKILQNPEEVSTKT